jgi:signal transduction histidine kinase
MSKPSNTGLTRDPLDLPSLCLAITEHAPLPIATVEGTTHIVHYVNPAFCRLMNKPAEQLVGKPFHELMAERDECVMLLDRVFRTKKAESHLEREDSKAHPVFWSYTMWPVLTNELLVGIMIQVTESGESHGKAVAMNEALMLGTVRQHVLTEPAEKLNQTLQAEIRERQQAEAALREAQARLAEHAGRLEAAVSERTRELTTTNQQLEAFVYSIAHDLRAPLRSMQGFSELLLEEAGAALTDAGQDYARRIAKSAQYMDALLLDLLAFSRISQQRVKLTSVELESVVEAVLARLQKDIQEKNAQVASAGPWPVVLAHEPTLDQVLYNLTANALKFVAPEARPVVRLRAEERAGFIRVWVEDQGIGIAPGHQEQTFGLFTRLQGDKYPGTGIGLAIVQKGIERMGGRVGVESAVGQGSRFWFELRKA